MRDDVLYMGSWQKNLHVSDGVTKQNVENKQQFYIEDKSLYNALFIIFFYIFAITPQDKFAFLL